MGILKAWLIGINGKPVTWSLLMVDNSRGRPFGAKSEIFLPTGLGPGPRRCQQEPQHQAGPRAAVKSSRRAGPWPAASRHTSLGARESLGSPRLIPHCSPVYAERGLQSSSCLLPETLGFRHRL